MRLYDVETPPQTAYSYAGDSASGATTPGSTTLRILIDKVQAAQNEISEITLILDHILAQDDLKDHLGLLPGQLHKILDLKIFIDEGVHSNYLALFTLFLSACVQVKSTKLGRSRNAEDPIMQESTAHLCDLKTCILGLEFALVALLKAQGREEQEMVTTVLNEDYQRRMEVFHHCLNISQRSRPFREQLRMKQGVSFTGSNSGVQVGMSNGPLSFVPPRR
ncbi:hypothetical protein N7523_005714 [Penicillium sp. IBT 18751x]|nr:hypothetical protein N7523_005714 [Penicillium sp. IBT 18751x]